MSQRLFGTFLTCLLLASFSGIATEPEVIAVAQNCEQSPQRKISLSAVDKEGKAVADLHPADLTISENKVSREILKLELVTDEPLSVAILIDTSGSQQGSLSGTKLAAQRFAESILQSGKNRVGLISFSEAAKVEEGLTNDLTKLRASIERVKFVAHTGAVVIRGLPNVRLNVPLGETAIWDTIKTTTDGILQSQDSGRRVILLLSDGEDTNSKTKMRDAIQHAAARDIAIFSVGIGEDQRLSRDKLNKLAEETGGRSFFPKRVKDLDGMLREIEQYLRSHYLLTYCTLSQKADKSLLKIQIEISNSQLRQSNLQLLYPHYGF